MDAVGMTHPDADHIAGLVLWEPLLAVRGMVARWEGTMNIVVQQARSWR